jgi:hypothetical protein
MVVVGDASTSIVVLVVDGVETVVGSLEGHASLAAVDALARLALEARRAECAIRVLAPSTALRELLDLVGLSGLVVDGPPAGGASSGP